MKHPKRSTQLFISLFLVVAIFISGLTFSTDRGDAAVMAVEPVSDSGETNTEAATIFLPVVMKDYPWVSPFGLESWQYLTEGSIYLQRAEELGTRWGRMNQKISWKELQPNEGDPIDWNQLTAFDDELRAFKEAGITPIVIVDDNPYWAVIPFLKDGVQTYSSCAAIRTDKFSAYANFIEQLVEKYSDSEFNVHHWELGNEPDVDPTLVPIDQVYGCWGDINDPYYGGEHYGEMLKVVTPVIKAADPFAKVWVGGLLLDNPNTTRPGYGRPELFLKGILISGAAPYFDIVGYHAYPPYQNVRKDYDLDPFSVWYSWGGNVIGKATYLRSIMNQYNVTKPVFLNETGLMCPDHSPYIAYCSPPVAGFYQAQADYVVRAFTRGLSENVMGYIWYTLESGWRYTGLLDGTDPKLVYYAYQNLISRLQGARFLSVVSNGDGIEAYAFETNHGETHVYWAIEDQTFSIQIPITQLNEAYSMYGDVLPKTVVGSNYQINVGFSPIYVVLNP